LIIFVPGAFDDGAAAEQKVLQEVVGIVVVMKAGRPHLDLSTLPVYLRELLAAPKWPQCLVFMGSIPKSHSNTKLFRVKLGTHLLCTLLKNRNGT
jgi:hypothetical protein